MDDEELVDWTRTRGALKRLISLFRCLSCHNELKEPCSFQMCDHYFCKSCALDLINTGTNCPACDAVLWREHMQISLKIPEVMKICERINTLICNDDDEPNNEINVHKKELCTTGVGGAQNGKHDVASEYLDDDVNTYVFQCPKSSADVPREMTEQVEHEIVEITDDSESINTNTILKTTEKADEYSEEISINVTPVCDTTSQACRITQPEPLEVSIGPSQQCHITQPDPIEVVTHIEEVKEISHCEVLDADQLANTEISFSNDDDVVVMNEVKTKAVDHCKNSSKKPGNTEITFNDVSDGDIFPFPLSGESNKENESLLVDPLKVINELRDEGKSVFDFCSGTTTKAIRFNRRNDDMDNNCDIDFLAEPVEPNSNSNKQDGTKTMTSIKSRAKRKAGKKNENEDIPEMPPSPSPIKSQFTNAISDRDCANGAQRNPSMCAKKPKFTYGNKNKGNSKVEQNSKAFPSKPIVQDEESVFDFCSGTVTKAIQFTRKDNESSEDEVLKELAERNGKRKRKVGVEKSSITKKDASKPNSDKENKKSKKNERTGKESPVNVAAAPPVKQAPAKTRTRNLEKKNKKGETQLHTACIKGNYEKVKELLELGALPNTRDFNQWTPLHEACNYGHVKVVELLLDHGAIIDCVAGEDNDTPLHDAVSNGRVEVACVLLRRGAPKHIKNKQGFIPADLAMTQEMKNIFNVFETSDVSADTRFDVSAVSVADCHVLVTTNLSSAENVEVTDCCNGLGGSMVPEFDLSVTHVICGTESGKMSKTRTMKYLLGVLTGKWMVTNDWIKESKAAGKWLPEVDYELSGSVGTANHGVPSTARVNVFKSLPKLFEGCSFFLSGSFKGRTTKETVTSLITFGGGKILYREPKITDLVRSSIIPSTSRSKKSKKGPDSGAGAISVRVYHARDNSAQVCCTEYIIYDPELTPGHKKVCSPTLCTAPLPWLFDCISNFQILDVQDAYEQLEGYKSSQE